MHHSAAKKGSISRSKVLAAQNVKIVGSHLSLPAWLLIGAILVSSIFCVWSRATVIRLGYEISRETRNYVVLKEANNALGAEMARLMAPGRLEPIARKKLGLLPPRNHQIVLMK